MKIAFILPSLEQKGPIIYVKYLIEELLKLKIQIDVYYFNDVKDIRLGVSIQKINFFEPINFSKYDIIHTHMAKADLYAFFFRSKIYNKWITTGHNFFRDDLKLSQNIIKSFFVIRLWSLALNACRHMVVSSNTMLIYYSKLFGKKNYKIIKTGVKNLRFIKRSPPPEHNFLTNLADRYVLIGSVGRLVKLKGYDQLIFFLKKNPKYAVVILGSGEDENRLKNLSIQNKVEDRFFLLGHKDNPGVYYKYFNIYAMVSYSEGFNLSAIEAMSYKCPLICSNLDVYREFFTNREVNFFDTGDIKSLSKAIRTCSKHINFYRNSAYNSFMKNFLSSKMAYEYFHFYKDIISSKNGIRK